MLTKKIINFEAPRNYMKKKVLIVANLSMHIMKVRKSLIQALEDAGYVVEIITARDKYFDVLIEEGYKIHELHALDSQGKSLFEQFKIYFEYKRLYQKINPDFVFHYTIKPNIYGTLAASRLKIPSVITINGIGQVYEHPLLFKTVSYLYRLACNKSKAVIFQNEDDRKIFLSGNIVKKEKTFLVNGSGIDCEQYSPEICNDEPVRNNTSFKFILTARLLWTKGLHEYYEAAKRIKLQYPDVTFYIVGYLMKEEKLGVTEDKMKIWKASGAIEFLGSVSDIRKVLCDCDIAVLPSYYREGVPRVLIEALAMAKPIITTDNVGCRETIIDKWNGFKIPVKNTDALYNAIEQMILADKQKISEFKTNSRKLAIEKFDEKGILSLYLSLADKYCRQPIQFSNSSVIPNLT